MHTYIHTYIHTYSHIQYTFPLLYRALTSDAKLGDSWYRYIYIHTYIHIYLHTYVIYFHAFLKVSIKIYYVYVCMYVCMQGRSLHCIKVRAGSNAVVLIHPNSAADGRGAVGHCIRVIHTYICDTISALIYLY